MRPFEVGQRLEVHADQRCFEDLASFVVLLGAWALGTRAHLGYSMDYPLAYKGRLASEAFPDLALGVDALHHIDAAVRSERPELVWFDVLHEDPERVQTGHVISNQQRPFEAMTAGMFLRYYESVLPTIVEHFGRSTVEWPATAQFARTVRNAFAHRGRIHIVGDQPTGIWRGYTIDPSAHGSPLMFQLLGVADAIVLVIDLDELIP